MPAARWCKAWGWAGDLVFVWDWGLGVCRRPSHVLLIRPQYPTELPRPALPPPSACLQGQAVAGITQVPSSVDNGLSVGSNTLVLLAITIATRLLAYVSIEISAALKFL